MKPKGPTYWPNSPTPIPPPHDRPFNFADAIRSRGLAVELEDPEVHNMRVERNGAIETALRMMNQVDQLHATLACERRMSKRVFALWCATVGALIAVGFGWRPW